MREFLVWVGERPRSYRDAMEVWRAHCPRHMIWEDAFAAGLVALSGDRRGTTVALTKRGEDVLRRRLLDG